MFGEDRAASVLRRFDDLSSIRRGYWDTLLQQCKEVVWPNTSDFQRIRPQGAPLMELCYDATAPWANGQFANNIQSAVANPFERWFNIEIDTLDHSILEDDEVKRWTETVSDIIYRCYAHPRANHKQALHENFLSEGAFGTGIIFQEWDEVWQIPTFRAMPMAHCFMDEDEKGFIDTLYREVKYTLRQAKQRFGEGNLPKEMLERKDPKEQFIFIHAVEPREERVPESPLAKDMRFASDWVCQDFKKIVWTSGYRSFPYHVPRWEKIAGQVYGRSPAMTALPDIKVLNQMKKATLEAAQKVVNPPVILPHDSFTSQFDMTPGALNYYDSTNGLSEDVVRAFTAGAQPQLGQEMMEPIKDFICQCFYLDAMNLPNKKERQTTTEINALQDQILRQISPLVGRQEAELLEPMIRRTYGLLSDNGKIPPHPTKIKGLKLKVTYVSRAAFAQKGGKLNSMKQWITESFIPLIQIAPEAKDRVDMDEVLTVSAELSDVTNRIIRTDADVSKIRSDRAKQQQQQQQLQAMESGSVALKNVAQAGQALPSTTGGQ